MTQRPAQHSDRSFSAGRASCFVEFDTVQEDLSLPLLLPQHPDTPSPNFYNICPEVDLMYAVLQDAIHCFQGQATRNVPDTQRLAREAEEWVFSDDVDWPFSFLNICVVLGLDPSYICLGLKRWRQCPPNERQKKGDGLQLQCGGRFELLHKAA
jgi:hypothetical protein